VGLREGKTLGSKQGEGIGCGFCYDQGKEVEQRLYVIGINFDINFGRAALKFNLDLILEELHYVENLMLILGELLVKHAVQRGIWVAIILFFRTTENHGKKLDCVGQSQDLPDAK
jgi:hypothetical protein